MVFVFKENTRSIIFLFNHAHYVILFMEDTANIRE